MEFKNRILKTVNLGLRTACGETLLVKYLKDGIVKFIVTDVYNVGCDNAKYAIEKMEMYAKPLTKQETKKINKLFI